ncbi:hypothetical protein GCM10010394_60430 [Streptomyces crystallinus]|uniref:Uncharacterized protein n=1 Tax=Streptomyces crystallinus TaxID=68191 RepID=A0ABN1GW89_9ACTN
MAEWGVGDWWGFPAGMWSRIGPLPAPSLNPPGVGPRPERSRLPPGVLSAAARWPLLAQFPAPLKACG